MLTIKREIQKKIVHKFVYDNNRMTTVVVVVLPYDKTLRVTSKPMKLEVKPQSITRSGVVTVNR